MGTRVGSYTWQRCEELKGEQGRMRSAAKLIELEIASGRLQKTETGCRNLRSLVKGDHGCKIKRSKRRTDIDPRLL